MKKNVVWNYVEEFDQKKTNILRQNAKGAIGTNNSASIAVIAIAANNLTKSYLHTYEGILDPFLLMTSVLT